MKQKKTGKIQIHHSIQFRRAAANGQFAVSFYFPCVFILIIYFNYLLVFIKTNFVRLFIIY